MSLVFCVLSCYSGVKELNPMNLHVAVLSKHEEPLCRRGGQIVRIEAWREWMGCEDEGGV